MRDLAYMLEWEQPPPEPVLDADGVPLPDQPPPPGPEYDEETGEELPPTLPEREPTEGCTCALRPDLPKAGARTTR